MIGVSPGTLRRQGKMMARPASGRDEVAFGRRRHRPRQFAFRFRPGYAAIVLLATAAAAISAGLLLTSSPGREQPRGAAEAVSVVTETQVNLRLAGATRAELDVRYLRVGPGNALRGPYTLWLDVVATGLPRATVFKATAGSCVDGRPRVLGTYSGVPDPNTDILVLNIDNLRLAQFGTVAWFRVSNPEGAQLGGIRGSGGFLAWNETTTLNFRTPDCP
jgi:hypothetical protein